MAKITYRELDTYKYQTVGVHRLNIGIVGYELLGHKYIHLAPDGWLTVFDGYCWNGANFPAINTKNSRRGSLWHDVGYQLIRMGIIPPEYRQHFDELLRSILVEDKMWKIRANNWYYAVRFGGGPCVEKCIEQQDVILEAP